MKTHFREAHQAIRNVDDDPINDTFDQANMVSEVLDGVRTIVRDQVAEAIPSYIPPTYNPPPQQSPQQHVNMLTGQVNQSFPLAYPSQQFDYAHMVTPPTQYVPHPSTPPAPYKPPQFQGNTQNIHPPNTNNLPGGFSNFGQG